MHSSTWAHAASTWITERICTHRFDYPRSKPKSVAFGQIPICTCFLSLPYKELNLWLPADNSKDRLKLWDRDVVELLSRR